MSEQSLIQIVVVAGLIIFLIGRQFVPQRVNGGRTWLFPIIITIYGLYLIAQHPPTALIDLGLLGLNVVVGLVLGFARGYSMRYWRDAAGQMMRQGTILTLLLWVVSFGARFGLEFAIHGGFTAQAQTELPLFVGVTLGAQSLAMWMRTQHVDSRETYASTIR
jgi:hypothetical protein